MYDPLNGRDIRSIPRTELQQISEQLQRVTRALNQEIGMRNKEDSFVWGWRQAGAYITFDDQQEAWREAEKQLGEGGGYRVQKVYL